MHRFATIAFALSTCIPTALFARAESLAEAYQSAFRVGVAANPDNYADDASDDARIIKANFNAITAENIMKFERIHPQPGVYVLAPADQLVDFAERNGMFVTGHTLIWHSQTPKWVFVDENGAPRTREALIEIMREHIAVVVGHYKGRVQSWDVVNEALNEDGTLRDSPWRKIIGDDFIELAFRFAHEADPDAELYYNDYLLEIPEKCAGAVAIVERLKAAGCRIDGVGVQGHMHIEGPSVESQEATINAIAASGVKAMITELDVDVLPAPDGWGNADIMRQHAANPAMNPFVNGLPEQMQKRQAARYAELFAMYLRNRDKIARVTLWGLNDGDSWLNGFPVRGRTNHALLWDRENNPKPAYFAILSEPE
jgi:endo-1,4-beta-xylanase